MAQEKAKGGNAMMKLAAFIVDKRNLFFLLLAIGVIFSMFSTNWIRVENDLKAYLPADCETRRGLDIMDDQFITYGTAQIMVENVSMTRAQALWESLKTVEGVASFLMGELKNMFLTNTRTKLAYLLLKPAMGGLKKMMSSSEVGGAPFLGISSPVFKAHGSSDARAIRSAVKQAMAYVEADVVGEIENSIEYMAL